MGGLDLNKVFGAILATVLVIMGLQTLSSVVFSDGSGHGGGHHGEEVSCVDQLKEKYAYYNAAACSGGGGATEVEEVYDLGLMLASADAGAGEKVFKGQCASCHNVDQGGANGTGPNLYGIIGAAKAANAGFGYSSAMSEKGGDWDYASMDEWLTAPSKYVRGTSMSYAGVKRDNQRADLIAYLASYSPNAPAFPDPLPAVAEEIVEGEEGVIIEGDVIGEGAEGETPAVVEGGDAPVEVPAPAEGTETETLPEAGEAVPADLLEEATETVEEAVQDAAQTAEDAAREAAEAAAGEAGGMIPEGAEQAAEKLDNPVED